MLEFRIRGCIDYTEKEECHPQRRPRGGNPGPSVWLEHHGRRWEVPQALTNILDYLSARDIPNCYEASYSRRKIDVQLVEMSMKKRGAYPLKSIIGNIIWQEKEKRCWHNMDESWKRYAR